MTYQEIIKAMNSAPRDPAGCTPPVVEAARAGGEDARLLVNAIHGWEIRNKRKAGPSDEAEVLAVRDQLIANMEEVKAKG
ncbi:hypothetical protein [Azospirillum brasilense]|uniref:hypothetical protein n=1 Tax=Azospirillum brasilense TaxID=192 RepID=UPI000E698E72|nr:hypothetical protein [Azospirillum brasilense]NUB25097.1 hypothetical protein [Azospirillum brasilense]NUB30579.1 hypothetical protein [Azospirillum brasilense]RIW07803.1 hypothetical protein D2T81_02895 [Azospirillum brasilense]